MKKAFFVKASSSTLGFMPGARWVKRKMPAAMLPRMRNARAVATPTSRTSSRSTSVFAGSGMGKGSTASGGIASSCEMGSNESTGYPGNEALISNVHHEEFVQERLKG